MRTTKTYRRTWSKWEHRNRIAFAYGSSEYRILAWRFRAQERAFQQFHEFFKQLRDSMLSSWGSFGTLLVPRDRLQFDPMSGRITISGTDAPTTPHKKEVSDEQD